MKILVIEPNQNISIGIKNSLLSAKHDVLEIHTLSEIDSSNIDAELLICDLNIKGIFELIQEISNQTSLKTKKMIGMVSRTNSELLTKATGAGFQYLLAKPFSSKLLHKMISSWDQQESANRQESKINRIILQCATDSLQAITQFAYVAGRPIVLPAHENLPSDFSAEAEVKLAGNLKCIRISLLKEGFSDNLQVLKTIDFTPEFTNMCQHLREKISTELNKEEKIYPKPLIETFKLGQQNTGDRLVVPFGFNATQIAHMELFLQTLETRVT